MRDVGADGEVNRDRNAFLVRGNQNTQLRVSGLHNSTRKVLPGRFAISNADAVSEFGNFIDAGAGFFRHAELAVFEGGIHVFGGIAGDGEFEIVNEGGAVHGDGGNETFIDEVDQDRPESHFDDMAAKAPNDGLFPLARVLDGCGQLTQIPGSQDVRQGIEEFCDGAAARGRLGKIAHVDFALARRERIRPHATE